MRVSLGVAALLVVVGGSLAAQDRPFQVATRLIRLDVSVLDRARQAVRDLTRADFQISEGRTSLTIRTFDTIAVPNAESLPTTATPVQPRLLPPDEPSVDPTSVNPGRLMVLVLDDDMTPANPKWATLGKNIGRALVDRMGPNDRMAVRFTRSGTTRLDLGTDKAALLAQIETYASGGFLALPPTLTMSDEVPRFQRSMSTLTYTVEALATLTERQKLIAYVGPGLPIDQTLGASTASRQALYHGDFTREMQALYQLAERANVVVYTFDPTGADGLERYTFDKILGSTAGAARGGGGGDLGQRIEATRRRAANIAQWTTDFAASVADNTGGRAFFRSDNFEPAVAQLFADTSFYYLIGVEPLGATPDGKFHEVTVRVARRDTQVRARRGYYFVP